MKPVSFRVGARLGDRLWCAAGILVSVAPFRCTRARGCAARPLERFLESHFPRRLPDVGGGFDIDLRRFGLLYALARKDSAWRVALVHELGKWVVAEPPPASSGGYGGESACRKARIRSWCYGWWRPRWRRRRPWGRRHTGGAFANPKVGIDCTGARLRRWSCFSWRHAGGSTPRRRGIS